MSDDTTPRDESDQRDERIAALLEVPPLDEVTRRRLVRTALASTAGPRSRLALAVSAAAAVILGLIVGAVVVTRPDDSTETAARPQDDASTTLEAPAQRASAPAADEAGSPAIAAAPATDLGDLGSVSSVEELRDKVTAARKREAVQEAPALPACAAQPPDVFGLVVVAAVGSGVVGAEPATVLVGTDPSGAEVAVVLQVADCVEVLRAPVDAG
jgi:hypothetical protein